MKLRNIFLAGLAVCTMAGCSKDETTDYSQMGEVDAYVSFGVTAALQTKSTVGEGGNEIEKEAKVQKLTAMIMPLLLLPRQKPWREMKRFVISSIL